MFGELGSGFSGVTSYYLVSIRNSGEFWCCHVDDAAPLGSDASSGENHSLNIQVSSNDLDM